MSIKTHSEIVACYINEGDEVSTLKSYKKRKKRHSKQALDQARRPTQRGRRTRFQQNGETSAFYEYALSLALAVIGG